MLKHHSEYFSAALNGSWKEAEENSITLNDIDPKTFEVFVHWLYIQKIATEGEVDDMLETYPSDEHDDDPYITVLTKAVVFGDRFLVPDFRKAAQNHIVESILYQDEVRQPAFLYASKYAFENFSEDHLLCEFFIDVHSRFMKHTEKYMDDIITGWFKENLPRTFLVELIGKYSSMVSEQSLDLSRSDYANYCVYHEHKDNHKRRVCKQGKEVTCSIEGPGCSRRKIRVE